MLVSKRLQKIISMAMERQKVIERLMSKGENLDDGFICHMCKVILWFGKNESWYETLASDIRKLAVRRGGDVFFRIRVGNNLSRSR